MRGRSLPFYKTKGKNKPEAPESSLQATIVQHLIMAGVFHHSIPNERKCSVQMHMKLRAMGLRKGAADLCLVIRGRAHYLECKKKGEKQEEAQKEFEADCISEGIPYSCVDNISDALITLSAWGVRAGRIAA